MTTDYVQMMDEAAASDISLVHKYRVLAAQGVGSHLFFEGDLDRLLYPAIVRSHFDEEVYLYEAEGYAGVINAFDEIKEIGLGYPLTFFFIDSDLRPYASFMPPVDPRIFQTALYSVESYLLTREAIKIFSTEADNLEVGSPHIGRCWDLFLSNIAVLSKPMKYVLAIALSEREAKRKPNLNNLNFSHLVSIGETGTLARKPNLLKTACRHMAVDPNEIDFSRLRYWANLLPNGEELNWFRGKNALWILIGTMKKYFKYVSASIPKDHKGKSFHCRISGASEYSFAAETFGRIRPLRDIVEYVQRTGSASH